MTTIQKMLTELNFHMTQEKIGVEVGLSQAAISRLIHGVSQNTTYQQGAKIKALYDKQFPDEVRDRVEAAAKINDLKKALVIAQGNYDEARAHVEDLQRRLNGILVRRCWLCRIKTFFKGWR